MATLKQQIEDGLQVGALVEKQENGHIYQFKASNNYGECIFLSLNLGCNNNNKDYAGFIYSPVVNSKGTEIWKLTTAYDSQVDQKTLPIDEPFWTGWVVHDCGIGKPYKFEIVDYPNSKSKIFEDGWHQEYLKSDCQPCLPPKNTSH